MPTFVRWDSTCEKWDEFCHIWNDCLKTITEITGGGAKPPEETLEAYNALEKRKKKKVIKVIVWLRGEKFEEEKEVEDYNVTVEDMELITEQYNKIEVKNIKVK